MLPAGLFEHFLNWKKERLARSWVLQDRAERKTRLQAVIELSAELERIREVNIFSTGMGEAVIEAIIEGDWEHARELGKMFDFKNECEAVQAEYGPLWERFFALVAVRCEAAMRRREGKPPLVE